MKKHVLTASLLSLALVASAQEVVSTGGDSYSGASGNVDFTVGEVVIFTGTDGTNDVTQGFHQTNWNFLGIESPDPAYEVSIYPNPVENNLHVKSSDFAGVSYLMTDVQGKIVASGELQSEEVIIAVGNFAPGHYSLSLNRNGEALKIFQLIKH